MDVITDQRHEQRQAEIEAAANRRGWSVRWATRSFDGGDFVYTKRGLVAVLEIDGEQSVVAIPVLMGKRVYWNYVAFDCRQWVV